ncbi:MAG: molybdopterin oxidoreductase, partial [Deltaproteobacteria bacterium]|nr:molybdopterin oxidoreductase [Deltaproteobacteria bacterium]
TFFLFTWSAAAYGPSFTIFLTKLLEKVSGKKLVKDNVIDLLAKISGWMILTYTIAKIIDTWYWIKYTLPGTGFRLMDFYDDNMLYGLWILVAEIVVCGIFPALILITKKGRSTSSLLWTAVILACIGVCINRWVMTTILPVAYGIILVMISYRYLPIFPQEKELNPVES